MCKSGINHIEIWVSNQLKSFEFYSGFLEIIGWSEISKNSIANENTELFFNEQPNLKIQKTLGIRHICFQACKREDVDKVSEFLKKNDTQIIRGPLVMKYSKKYYTIDFYDPDGLIVEVSYTPNMIFSKTKS